MSFLFPRTITISRPGKDDSVGALDYAGLDIANETPVLGSTPAKIQADRQGQAPETKLPSNAAGQSIWKIIFKVPLGIVAGGDIITSEIGERFQVIGPPYWGPLVTTCRCQILES